MKLARVGIVAAAIVAVAAAAAYIGALPQPTTSPTNSAAPEGTFAVIPDSDPPRLRDQSLRVEKVIEGLSAPTSMVFVGDDDILVLQKDDGRVRMVQDGRLLEAPLLDLDVDNRSERGLLGIAVKDSWVFLYLTEDDGGVKNRVYRYDFDGSSLANPVMILDLPGTPGPNHDGGKMTIGPDGFLYVVTGDLNRNGQVQNFKNGPAPDYTSAVLKVDSDGRPKANVLSGENLTAYFAYGVRNSFGLDFDPKTGMLWDTENGPADYDEINIVRPGFNSGWELVMGPISRTDAGEDDLVRFEGSHYADPVFSWRQAIGVTDMEFLNSTALGGYSHSLFVGDINNGHLYNFALNKERTDLELGQLTDRVADNQGELEPFILGRGFGGITDIETGPDGLLYILSFDGSIYRLAQ